MKYLLIALLITSTITLSQEPVPEIKTIENQFDKIYRTSTTYQVYKVISKEGFLGLKSNVLDSLKSAKETILLKENLLKQEKSKTQKSNETLNQTQQNLEVALQKENSISFFGIPLSKTSYNLILWSFIVILIISLAYFIFKFIHSNVLTKEAQENLFYTEKEFEKHKKISLEREQKLRRQLQDEINKQRNV